MSAKPPARLLIVAGSDSSGGAGIQADIKTATVFGAYAMTAITAVTVQDTRGVSSFHAVPDDIVAAQIGAVLADLGADAIKTGMLGSAGIVKAAAGALLPYKDIPLIVDTVMIAKGGTALLDEAGIDAMKRHLFPLAALITPNAPEAARLTGLKVETEDEFMRAGEALLAMGPRAVLIKGGHVPGISVSDVLMDKSGVETFRSERLLNPATHGTGCTLASGIAAGIAQGMNLYDSIVRARHFVHEAIRSGLALGSGTGPVNHLHPIKPFEV